MTRIPTATRRQRVEVRASQTGPKLPSLHALPRHALPRFTAGTAKQCRTWLSPGRIERTAFHREAEGFPPGPGRRGFPPRSPLNVVGAQEIRANTVLPARRRDIELHTADGLRLVGELALPLERDPVATLVTLHPLPTHGGFMDSNVFKKASYRLPALADIAVLRFNTRGTTSPRGTSEGAFHEARDERFDVAAAIEFARVAQDPALPNRWLLGWSFGTAFFFNDAATPEISALSLHGPPLK